jgi:nucleoid DNA-binding protein
LEALASVSDKQLTDLQADMGMDLSNYVSQLLQQHGQLNVPGLVFFVHLRKSSYYDNETGTLYPPYYETTFEPPHTDDEDNMLLNFVAETRNISPTSAKYFIDKYADTIKAKAAAGEFDFEGLGSFSTNERSALVFKSHQAETVYNSPLFGLPPVKIQKLVSESQPIEEEAEVPAAIITEPIQEEVTPEVIAEAKPQPVVSAPSAVTVNQAYASPVPVKKEPVPAPPVYEEEVEEQPKSKAVYWIIAVVVVAAIAGFLAYQYKIINFNGPTDVKPQQKAQPAPVKADTDSTTIDTSALAPTTAKADSTVKAAQPVVHAAPILGEIPKDTWLILGGSFNNYLNATRAVTNYRALGHPEARLLDSVQRKEFFVYKIVFGYQPTKKQADSVRSEILKPRTIKAKFIFVEPYK